MMTVAEQKAVIDAVPEDLRKKYELECPSDYSEYQGIQRDGYVYYPDIHTIVVDDAIGVWWEHDACDVRNLDLDDPKDIEKLLYNARRRIDGKQFTLYMTVRPSRKNPGYMGIGVHYRDPAEIYKDGVSFEKISYDSSFICYKPHEYDLEHDERLMALAKALFVCARYDTVQVFPWADESGEHWEVTYPCG